MESQIRFLVEQYYDVQKLRVEAFNRIVAYVKSHSCLVNQGGYASHIYLENQRSYASHLLIEPPKIYAKGGSLPNDFLQAESLTTSASFLPQNQEAMKNE